MNIVKLINVAANKVNGGQDTLTGVKIALLKYFHDNPCYFDVEKYLKDIFDSFTVNTIISLWNREQVKLYDEAEYSLSASERTMVREVIFRDDFILSNADSKIIGIIYEAGLTLSDKKKTGTVYTPEDISEYMTDIVREKITPSSKLIEIIMLIWSQGIGKIKKCAFAV